MSKSAAKSESKSEPKQESVDELIARLERAYIDAEKALNEHNEKLPVLQNNVFKAYKEATSARLQYYASVINAQTERLRKLDGKELPTIVEERSDNL